MDLNFYSQILTVTIEAFSALLGISAALFLYLHQRYWSVLEDVRKRIDSNLRHIRQVLQKINPSYQFNFPYLEKGNVPLGKHKTFLRVINKVKEDFKDNLDQEVEVDVGKRVVKNEIEDRTIEVTMDMRFLEHFMQKPQYPKILYFILLLVCGFPIIVAFYNLLLMTYNIPISKDAAYVQFYINLFCLFMFGFISIKLSRP